ncbi:MAG TPA: AMP-binding protein, partial [Spirochaetota bacterium]|nr:AMP-binding protein [Spirochaetota bacterium]
MLNNYLKKTDFNSYEDFYNNFKVDVPKYFNFAYDIVEQYAKIEPDKIAMVWCDDKGNDAIFTFKEIDNYANKVANFFASLGITKGDPVMLILKRRYEFWFSIIALHKIGAVAIPATHLLTKKDIIYRNNAASVKMIVSVPDNEVIENIENAKADSPTLKHVVSIGKGKDGIIDFYQGIEKQSDKFTKPAYIDKLTESDLMLLYFTSGTTGMPKMVAHNFKYPLGHIITAKYWQNVQDNGLHLTVADTGWAKAAWGKIYGQWICGCAVFVYDYDKFVPKNLLTVLSKYKVTSFCAPPTIYRYIIKENLKEFDLTKLKHCSIAGEPLNPEVYNQFLSLTGLKLIEGYGQTELTLSVGTFPWIEPKPGSMGKPSPYYDIDIVNEDRSSCEVGEVGQIVLRTDKIRPLGMFNGYYRDAELTNKVWNGNIYFTGDTAWKDEDGYLWFVGRTDDIIKSSGYRIGPFEVESALLEHPAVLECAVTGVPDPDRGQVVK